MTTPTCPTESVEQQRLFQWAKLQYGAHPELQLLYHIPNEGKRSVATGRRMRAEGLRRGVPDICLPVARGRFHGLYIELKRQHGGKVSDAQRGWLEALAGQNYAVALCKGWEAAAKIITEYINQRTEESP